MSPDTVERRLPGDLAMWFFILAELSVFSLLLLAFAGAQAWQPELFRAGREQLDSRWGLLLTVALLSSGCSPRWRCMRCAADGRARRAAGCWRRCCWRWSTSA